MTSDRKALWSAPARPAWYWFGSCRIVVPLAVFILINVLYLSRYPLLLRSDTPSFTYLRENIRRDAAEGSGSAPQYAGVVHPEARSNAPAFCRKLTENPRPRNPDDPSCTADVPTAPNFNVDCGRFFSQYKQDIWFYLAVARHIGRSTYVDVGSNHPIVISNSYFLDACLGWRGICVEAQEDYYEKIRKYRSCTLAPCVSSKFETVSFVNAHDLGGMERNNKNVNGTAEWQQRAHTANRTSMDCVPLSHVLKTAGMRHVTFMSVDVEGAEYDVLLGVDWDTTEIWFITLEGNEEKAPAYLREKGYVAISYVNDGESPDIFFASPEAVKAIENHAGPGYLESVIVPAV